MSARGGQDLPHEAQLTMLDPRGTSKPLSPYNSILSLRKKRALSEALKSGEGKRTKPINLVEDSDETELGARSSDCLSPEPVDAISLTTPCAVNDDETKAEDELSDLDGFIPISELVKRGGDLGKRAEFILSQFGNRHDSAHGDDLASRAGRSRHKTPGLDPTSKPAGARGGFYVNRRRKQ